jgi:hypothetical protein
VPENRRSPAKSFSSAQKFTGFRIVRFEAANYQDRTGLTPDNSKSGHAFFSSGHFQKILRAGLTMVASAILADVAPRLSASAARRRPVRRNKLGNDQTLLIRLVAKIKMGRDGALRRPRRNR